MPCSDGGLSYEQIEREKQQKVRMEREVKLRTQIACAALSWIEANGYTMDFEQCIDPDENGFDVNDLRKWWANHKREDLARRRKEEKEKAELDEKRLKEENRKKVLAELSDNQLEALGLKRIVKRYD